MRFSSRFLYLLFFIFLKYLQLITMEIRGDKIERNDTPNSFSSLSSGTSPLFYPEIFPGERKRSSVMTTSRKRRQVKESLKYCSLSSFSRIHRLFFLETLGGIYAISFMSTERNDLNIIVSTNDAPNKMFQCNRLDFFPETFRCRHGRLRWFRKYG